MTLYSDTTIEEAAIKFRDEYIDYVTYLGMKVYDGAAMRNAFKAGITWYQANSGYHRMKSLLEVCQALPSILGCNDWHNLDPEGRINILRLAISALEATK